MFLTAAHELGAAPEDSVVMEDAAAGIQAAKAGGMAAIGIARAHDAGLLAAAHADIVVSTLDDVDLSALADGRLAVKRPKPVARRRPETRYAQSSGAKIAYQVSGTGPRRTWSWCLGWSRTWTSSGSRPSYRRFVRALEQGGRLIRLDKRGTGLSDPAGELPTTQERVQDVAAVMAAARSSRRCAVRVCPTAGGPRSRSLPPIPAGRGA